MQHALKAWELKNEPQYLLTLAAVYAENCQFDKAVESQQQALDSADLLKDDPQRTKRLAEERQQLELYELQARWEHERWLPGASNERSGYRGIELSKVQGVTVGAAR